MNKNLHTLQSTINNIEDDGMGNYINVDKTKLMTLINDAIKLNGKSVQIEKVEKTDFSKIKLAVTQFQNQLNTQMIENMYDFEVGCYFCMKYVKCYAVKYKNECWQNICKNCIYLPIINQYILPGGDR